MGALRLAAVLAGCLLVASCADEGVDEAYENLQLTAALIQLREAGGPGAALPLTGVKGIDPAAVVCILSAYQHEGEGALGAALNEQLKHARYRPAADRWALAQLRPGGKLEVAVIRQRERQLAGVRSGGDTRTCAKASEITVIPGREHDVMFLLAAPEPQPAPPRTDSDNMKLRLSGALKSR